MKAVGIVNYLAVDDERAFIDFDAPKPSPAGRDLLIAVNAIAVNPVDVKVRAGRGNPGVTEDPPRVIGWDASGVVDAVGPEVTLFKPGDEVFYAGDITRPGCNAEYQLVDERIVGTKPRSLSHAEAAAEIDAGRIRTTVSEVVSPINATNLREVHRRIETGQAKGKIVLDGF